MSPATRKVVAAAVLTLCLALSGYFLCRPVWQIEHPADPQLVTASYRGWLWQRPPHAHLDIAGLMFAGFLPLALGLGTATLLAQERNRQSRQRSR